jgi:Histidine phosphatase superfamily (branch 2)
MNLPKTWLIVLFPKVSPLLVFVLDVSPPLIFLVCFTEYGTTIEEKRSVAVKICHSLLEKLAFDLSVARQDSQQDMRYLIDYSADLPINTMGRRIRTRLYFTSESHLHTVLNVLRFADADPNMKPILSSHGMEIINNTAELCYLTQLVIRVFEDCRHRRPDMQDDPRRFRVELLFSPGATATPLHLDENNRDTDLSRLDTAPLQLIGREDLTCQELESFFDEAMIAGRSDDKEYPDIGSDIASLPAFPDPTLTASQSTHPEKKALARESPKDGVAGSDVKESVNGDADRQGANISDKIFAAGTACTDNIDEDSTQENLSLEESGHPPSEAARKQIASQENKSAESNFPEVQKTSRSDEDSKQADADDSTSNSEELEETSEVVRRLVARKQFWTSVAIGSFVLGAGCLLLAMRLADDSRQRRWYSQRHHTHR